MAAPDDIARRILARMKDLGLSYGDLASKTGIYKSALQRYASGTTEKIPLDAIERISKALGFQPGALIGWESEDAGKGSDIERAYPSELTTNLSKNKEAPDEAEGYKYSARVEEAAVLIESLEADDRQTVIELAQSLRRRREQ